MEGGKMKERKKLEVIVELTERKGDFFDYATLNDIITSYTITVHASEDLTLSPESYLKLREVTKGKYPSFRSLSHRSLGNGRLNCWVATIMLPKMYSIRNGEMIVEIFPWEWCADLLEKKGKVLYYDLEERLEIAKAKINKVPIIPIEEFLEMLKNPVPYENFSFPVNEYMPGVKRKKRIDPDPLDTRRNRYYAPALRDYSLEESYEFLRNLAREEEIERVALLPYDWEIDFIWFCLLGKDPHTGFYVHNENGFPIDTKEFLLAPYIINMRKK